jgi:hypothetical protein
MPTSRCLIPTGVSPQELTGQVTATFLRGRLVWENGALVGAGRGRYIARPTASR